MIAVDECIKQANEHSKKARQSGLTKRQRDVLYAMSRTWNTLASQSALLAQLQAAEVITPSVP